MTAPEKTEQAEAERYLRERLAACKRGPGGAPQSLIDHSVEIVLVGMDRLRAVVQVAEKTSAVIERVLNADASEGTPIWEWTEHEADMGVREVLSAGEELAAALDTLAD